MTAYDHDTARLTPGDMNVADYMTKNEIGEQIRSIFTDKLLENDLGAGIRVSFGGNTINLVCCQNLDISLS